MGPVVYIDMLFLINFLMDTFTLYTSSLISKTKVSQLRLICSASVLSLYSCAVFFPRIGFIYSVLGKIIILAITSLIAFPSKNLKLTIRNIIVFFTVSAVYGGILFAMIFATDFGLQTKATISNGEIYLDIKASTIAFAVVLSYICVYIISYVKKQGKTSNNTYSMEIFLNSKNIKLNAFGDTGCNLTDPLTDNPAIIIDPIYAKKLTPKKNTDISSNINYIILPFTAMGCEKGYMNGFVPEKVIINDTEVKDCVIAIATHNLWKNSNIDAIFNPIILQKEV